MSVVDDQSFRIGTAPLTDVQLRLLPLVGDAPHKDRIFLSTEFVTEHPGEVRRNLRLLEMVVDEAVGRLRPFQDDVGPLLTMVSEEAAVKSLTLGLKHADFNLDTRLLQFSDASSLHLGKLVDAADDHPSYTFLDNQVGTRRCLAVVRTRLQTHVDG